MTMLLCKNSKLFMTSKYEAVSSLLLDKEVLHLSLVSMKYFKIIKRTNTRHFKKLKLLIKWSFFKKLTLSIGTPSVINRWLYPILQSKAYKILLGEPF